MVKNGGQAATLDSDEFGIARETALLFANLVWGFVSRQLKAGIPVIC